MQRPAIVALVRGAAPRAGRRGRRRRAPAREGALSRPRAAPLRGRPRTGCRHGTTPGRDLVEAVRAAGRFSLPCDRLRSGSSWSRHGPGDHGRSGRSARAHTRARPSAVWMRRAGPARRGSRRRPRRRSLLRSGLRIAELRCPFGRTARSTSVWRRRRAGFAGSAGVWVHDLRTGRTGGVDADVRFPAASTVKLGVLAAALASHPRPERSPLIYDATQIGASGRRISEPTGSSAASGSAPWPTDSDGSE